MAFLIRFTIENTPKIPGPPDGFFLSNFFHASIPSKSKQLTAYAVAKINEIDLMVIENGDKLVPIKPVCDILGVAPNKQIEKIQKDQILSSVGTLKVSTGSDGKQYEGRID